MDNLSKFDKAGLTRDDILYFLHCGYFVDYHNSNYSFDATSINKKLYSGKSLNQLVYLGSKILNNNFEKRIMPDRKNLVFLSGGLDSRLILGFLLEKFPAEEIETLTFGIPGSLDFEIGNYIAKIVGTNHTSINLNESEINYEDLIADSRAMQSQCYLLSNMPTNILYEKYHDHLIWSGFIGDLVAGSYHSYDHCQTIQQAIWDSFRSDKVVKSIRLENPSIEFIKEKCNFIPVSKRNMPLFTQAFYNNHVTKLTYPNIIFKDLDFELPLIDKTWFNFINSVDQKYLLDQKLYKLICLNYFPDLFNKPCKNNTGLSIRHGKIMTSLSNFFGSLNRKLSRSYLGSSKRLNYRNNDYEFRFNSSIRNFLTDILSDFDLTDFGIKLNIRDLLKEQSEGALHSRIIINLLSLRVNLKTKLESSKKS